MLSRRTVRRHFLFRPDDKMNQVFLYVLGVMAKKHDILVHVPMLMSTHPHLVFTDTKGNHLSLIHI